MVAPNKYPSELTTKGCERCHKSYRSRKLDDPEYYRKYTQLQRMTVILAYGGKCFCCGETEPKFLTIDHKFGSGRSEDGGYVPKRHEINKGNGGYHYYRRIIKAGFPDVLQVLCWNCNSSKGAYGKCPHQVARESVAKLELSFGGGE